MTLDEVVARLADLRADYARKDAHMKAAAVLDDVLVLLGQVDGTAAGVGRDLTTRQAAERLGIRSHRTVERYCRERRFPNAYRTSGQTGDWRIPAGDVDEFRRRPGRGAGLRAV